MKEKEVADLFEQIWTGEDIPKLTALISRMTPEDACKKLPNAPYSIITNILHADFWQKIWLCHLKGEKAESFLKDWRVPEKNEWNEIRESFIRNFLEAKRIAESTPLEHKMKDNETALHKLHCIAVHTTYHLGQVNLLKRMLRKSKS